MPEPLWLSLDARAPDAGAVEQAVACLRGGGLLIYPTDTLYAFGGAALLPGVAERVRAAKGREQGKPLPVVAADLEQARGLARSWPPAAALLSSRFWPGPLTLVLRSRADLPGAVTAGGVTIAVRVPGLGLTRALCRGAGALISTSANRAGEPPALHPTAAAAAVGDVVSLVLDAGPLQSAPSTIVDLSGPAPRLLREGSLAWPAIEAVLREGAAPLE